MIKLDFKETILIMLIKNGGFIEKVENVNRLGEKPAIFEVFDCLLDHYTKFYNSLQSISYDFIKDLYTKLYGDLLFKIDPLLYKTAVERSLNIYPGSYKKMEVFDCILSEIALLDMSNIELDMSASEVVEHPYIFTV